MQLLYYTSVSAKVVGPKTIFREVGNSKEEDYINGFDEKKIKQTTNGILKHGTNLKNINRVKGKPLPSFQTAVVTFCREEERN
jgi:hypothetical protein